MQCQPPGRLNLHGGIGKHPLNGLAISDGLAEGHALLGKVYGHLQQTLSRANTARSNDPSTLANPLHTKPESATDFSQYMVFRHTHILKEEFSGRPSAHCSNRARGPAHSAIHEEACHAAVLRRL